MMRKWAVIFLVVIASCATIESSEVRLQNRENLQYLRPGISRQEVLEIMGTETAYADREINNPYKTGTIDAFSDEFIEILFYYTDTKRDDNAITDDELTPLVLENEVLVGWGWTFLISRYPEVDFGCLLRYDNSEEK